MNLLNEVISSIAAYHSIPRAKITETSSLMNDLGIIGDDADDMIQMLENKFCVDLSDIDISRYFHGESAFAMGSKEELTVGQIAELIYQRRSK